MMIWCRRGNAVAGVVALVLLTLSLAGGCQQPFMNGDEAPTFAELRDRYNVRTERIEQIWSRAVVEIRYQDERGRRQFEQGDGHLFVRSPNELGLSIGKLGNIMYWVGGDEQRFWFFDLNPPSGEPRTATVGSHEEVARSGSEELPVPVRPDQLVHLLGVAPMPEPPAGMSVEVQREGGADVVVIPADEAGEAWWRYELEISSGLPRRIVLLDDERREIVASALSRYRPLTRHEVPPGGWPDIPTSTQITMPTTDRARLDLYLDEPSDGKARDRVRDVHFDFEALVDMLGPGEVRMVVAE